ncbi:MAG TPA: NAD(P)/FAD-dependent oxidoreductase [Candidatus Paceibacterota bacterium]
MTQLYKDIYDVIVIGAGASGMMAAGRAAERGLRVLLLERNKEVGAKLGITGGGRCNITNAEYDNRALLKHYGAAESFLYSPFSQFGVQETFSFFESQGLPLIIQARKRVFPETENAKDVVRVMKKYCTDRHVTIKTGTAVSDIIAEGDMVTAVRTPDAVYKGRAIVLATGGMSHPETGSSGDGFKWLQDLGHAVKRATPTIVPLVVEEPWVRILSGVSLSFMKITFFLDGKKHFKEVGKILFTHFGLSGPLILNSAGRVAELLSAGHVTAHIDAYPDTDHGALEKRIIAVFDAHKNKEIKNVLKDIVPHGFMPAVPLLLPAFDLEQRVHSVSKEDRKKLAHILKALPVTITGLMGFERAVVADGGVVLSEVDTRTMRSKKYSNMYITGDLLNINRPSGGYSLQLCWTTGFVAGNSI